MSDDAWPPLEGHQIIVNPGDVDDADTINAKIREAEVQRMISLGETDL